MPGTQLSGALEKRKIRTMTAPGGLGSVNTGFLDDSMMSSVRMAGMAGPPLPPDPGPTEMK